MNGKRVLKIKRLNVGVVFVKMIDEDWYKLLGVIVLIVISGYLTMSITEDLFPTPTIRVAPGAIIYYSDLYFDEGRDRCLFPSSNGGIVIANNVSEINCSEEKKRFNK